MLGISMDCVICALNGLLAGEIVSGDKESDSTISNVTKAVSMFLDDSGHHNLFARSISVANIDWTLAAPNRYPKVRCVLATNFCHMNKPSNIEFAWKTGILKFDNFSFRPRIHHPLYWCKEIELVFVTIIWKRKTKFNQDG